MCANRQQWPDLEEDEASTMPMHQPVALLAPKNILVGATDEETFFIDDTIQHDALDLGMDFAQSFADLYVDPDMFIASAAHEEIRHQQKENTSIVMRPDSSALLSGGEEKRPNPHYSLTSTISDASTDNDASPATTIFSLAESASTAPTSENESEAPQEKGKEAETKEAEQRDAPSAKEEEEAEELAESLLFAPNKPVRSLLASPIDHDARARSDSPQRPTRAQEALQIARPPPPSKRIHQVDVFSDAYDSSDSAPGIPASSSQEDRLRALKKSALSRFNSSDSHDSRQSEPINNNNAASTTASATTSTATTTSPSRMPPPLRVLFPLQEISFKKTFLEDVDYSDKEARDILAAKFPSLCEPPVKMFGENGEPLPPTKKEETSAEERLARKEALAISFRGKKMHSLVKSMVILESRSASWKRVGPAKFLDANSAPKKALPVVPDPWTLEFYHQDLDKLRTEAKSKRAFEITDSRVEAMCVTCKGKGSDVCQTCKGEEADECWWCTGTGKKKDRYRDCEKCNGLGKLKCQACLGKLVGTCTPCEGQGYGLFSLIVNIKVRRVDFPPIPDSALLSDGSNSRQQQVSSSAGGDVSSPQMEEDKIKEAAIQRTRDLVNKLVATSNFRAKIPFRPLTASCAWELSKSKLVEVEVPQAAKMGVASLKAALSDGVRRKKSISSLRPAGLHRRIATATRYFLLPSDPDLRPASMEKSDFLEALLGEKLPVGITQSDEQIAMAFRKFQPVSHSNELPDVPTTGRAMTPVSSAFPPQETPLQQMCLSPSQGLTRPRNDTASSYTTCLSPPPMTPANKTEHEASSSSPAATARGRERAATSLTSGTTNNPTPSYFELLQRSFPKATRRPSSAASAGRNRAMTASPSLATQQQQQKQAPQYHYQRRISGPISGPIGGLHGPPSSSSPSSHLASSSFPTTKSLQSQLASYNMI